MTKTSALQTNYANGQNCILHSSDFSKANKKCPSFFIPNILGAHLCDNSHTMPWYPSNFQKKSFLFHISFPVQDLSGVTIQHFLCRSWADLYNFPVENKSTNISSPRYMYKKSWILTPIRSCTWNETWDFSMTYFICSMHTLTIYREFYPKLKHPKSSIYTQKNKYFAYFVSFWGVWIWVLSLNTDYFRCECMVR